MPLADGTTFAGYTILGLLGSGGMGEVYLAQHPRLPRRAQAVAEGMVGRPGLPGAVQPRGRPGVDRFRYRSTAWSGRVEQVSQDAKHV
jgi:serine/threonine protein kinase